jgi:hypothetical protein
MMADTRQAPPGIDPARPSSARIYDYLLGGENSFESDREAAEKLKKRIPEVTDTAWANRGFHQRAAKWIAEQGVTQFIDIGAGLPTVGNTHEVVGRVAPQARVVYADNDPIVLLHGGELLRDEPTATVILADLRDPGSVLDNPELRGLIDFTEPVGLLATAVLHFVSDADDPYALVARYVAALADGSYLALSHRTVDQKPPLALQTLSEVGDLAAGGSHYRSKEEIRRFFDGLQLVPPYQGADPDVAWVGLWGCEDPRLADSEGSRWLYCGVGRKNLPGLAALVQRASGTT